MNIPKNDHSRTILADRFSEMMDSTPAIAPLVGRNIKNLPPMLKEFAYDISSWPVILSKETTDKLEQISITLPNLQKKIPELYFNNETQKFADFYFQGNIAQAKSALACLKQNFDISCRLDLVTTDEGFKVLEINAGSSLGGWQMDNFEEAIRSCHPTLVQQIKSKQLSFRSFQYSYIAFLIRKITEHVLNVREEINIFIVDKRAPMVTKNPLFDMLLNGYLAHTGKKGNAYVGNIEALKIKNDQLCATGNIPIHSVLMMSFGEEEMSSDLLEAVLTKKVYFPDHIGCQIMRDKRSLAILRTMATANMFSEQENKLILDVIPWTVLLEEGNVDYQGDNRDLYTLLRENKDGFVIKPANGFKGDDVYVGKSLTTEEWEKAVSNSIQTKSFIVQEYCASLSFLAPNKENQWVDQQLIWGAFGFGDSYGGVFARMAEPKKGKGVINAATGAISAIVYEANA